MRALEFNHLLPKLLEYLTVFFGVLTPSQALPLYV